MRLYHECGGWLEGGHAAQQKEERGLTFYLKKKVQEQDLDVIRGVGSEQEKVAASCQTMHRKEQVFQLYKTSSEFKEANSVVLDML